MPKEEKPLSATNPEVAGELVYILDDPCLDATRVTRYSKLVSLWMDEEGYIWAAEIKSIVCNGSDNPFSSSFRTWPGMNDIATRKPEIAIKLISVLDDDSLDSSTLSCGSDKMASWMDDAGFVFYGRINHITAGPDYCPFKSGWKAWPGLTDLATKTLDSPNQLVNVLDDEFLDSDTVTCGSSLMASWINDQGFIFPEIIHSISTGNVNCPYVSGRKAWPGTTDLASKNPSVANRLISVIDNEFLDSNTITSGSGLYAAWISENGYLFSTRINDVTENPDRCPFSRGNRVWPGLNGLGDQERLDVQDSPDDRDGLDDQDCQDYICPDIAEILVCILDDEGLDAGTVSSSSVLMGLWLNSNGFLFCSRIVAVTSSPNHCSFSPDMVWPGLNDLATRKPGIAKHLLSVLDDEFLDSTTISYGSNMMASWMDENCFIWPSSISKRSSVSNPFVPRRKVWPGFNDLATTDPYVSEMIVCILDDDYSDENTVSRGSNAYACFISDSGFLWSAQISMVTICNTREPFIGRKTWPGINDLSEKAPIIAGQLVSVLDDSLLDACTVTSGSPFFALWMNDEGYLWHSSISSRVAARSNGCPFTCHPRHKVWPGIGDLETVFPEIAKEFCVEQNKSHPCVISCYSLVSYKWECPRCHQIYRMVVSNRTRLGGGCKCHEETV